MIDVFQVSAGAMAAVREVQNRAGTWFDPDLVAAFTRVAARGGFSLASGRNPSAVKRGAGSASAGGFHTRRNSARLPIDTIAAMTSTSQGPWKLDTRYCVIAKLDLLDVSPDKREAIESKNVRELVS